MIVKRILPFSTGAVGGRTLLSALCAFVLPILGGCAKHGDGGGPLVVSGNIEVVDAQLGFKIAGRVAERSVSEGNRVKKGQAIARLEDAEQVEQLALRRGELNAALAALAELEAGSRPQEIATAEAAAQSAEAELERVKLEYARQKELRAKDAIAEREYEAAAAQLKVAEAALREAVEQMKLVKEGPRAETISQARAKVEQAKASLALAETQVENTKLFSPMDGVALSHNVEVGEYVSPGTPVATVADTLHLWVRAYVNQSDLGRVHLGQKVQVKTDFSGAKAYEGTVGFIASDAEFTPKTIQTPKERVKLVFRIKVYVTNTEDELKPGLPADVVIP